MWVSWGNDSTQGERMSTESHSVDETRILFDTGGDLGGVDWDFDLLSRQHCGDVFGQLNPIFSLKVRNI